MKGLIRFNTDYLKDANNDTKWRFIDASGFEWKTSSISFFGCNCRTETCEVDVDGEKKIKHHIAVEYSQMVIDKRTGHFFLKP